MDEAKVTVTRLDSIEKAYDRGRRQGQIEILAKLAELDSHHWCGDGDTGQYLCYFCGEREHKPDCLWLRASQLPVLDGEEQP